MCTSKQFDKISAHTHTLKRSVNQRPACPELARLGAALALRLHLRDPEAGLSVLVVRLELEHLDWG